MSGFKLVPAAGSVAAQAKAAEAAKENSSSSRRTSRCVDQPIRSSRRRSSGGGALTAWNALRRSDQAAIFAKAVAGAGLADLLNNASAVLTVLAPSDAAMRVAGTQLPPLQKAIRELVDESNRPLLLTEMSGGLGGGDFTAKEISDVVKAHVVVGRAVRADDLLSGRSGGGMVTPLLGNTATLFLGRQQDKLTAQTRAADANVLPVLAGNDAAAKMILCSHAVHLLDAVLLP